MSTSYSRDDLAHSQDGMIACGYCAIVIDPGYGEMVYLVGLKEGFSFYHLGTCSQGALRDAGLPLPGEPGDSQDEYGSAPADGDAPGFAHLMGFQDMLGEAAETGKVQG